MLDKSEVKGLIFHPEKIVRQYAMSISLKVALVIQRLPICCWNYTAKVLMMKRLWIY